MLQRVYVTPYVIFKLLDLEEHHSNKMQEKQLQESRIQNSKGTKGFPGPLEVIFIDYQFMLYFN